MPQYSLKEKLHHLRSLQNPDAAAADLELLSSLDKANSQLSIWAINPKRYAEDILFSLLDVAAAEDIRLNRRRRSVEKEHPAPEPSSDSDPKVTTSEALVAGEEPKVTTSEAPAADAEAALDEAEQRADEAEERADEAEQRAADAEAALEEAKKKDASKKKKNTRT